VNRLAKLHGARTCVLVYRDDHFAWQSVQVDRRCSFSVILRCRSWFNKIRVQAIVNDSEAPLIRTQTSVLKITRLSLLVLLCAIACQAVAQDQSEQQGSTPSATVELDSLQATRLDELARLLDRKIAQRDTLRQSLVGADESSMSKEREALASAERDIARLRNTFEIVALGDTDTSLLDIEDEPETDWRQDLVEILDPLVESLKSLTERPRQLAELLDGRSTVFF